MPGTADNRILFINHWARELGGAEHSLLDLLEETATRCEVFLVASEEGILLDRARSLGVTVSVIPCSKAIRNFRRGGLAIAALREWRGLLSFFRYVLGVWNLVRHIRPGLIHANVPKSHMALFLVRIFGYRGICCFHLREQFEKGSLPYRLYALLYRPKRAFVIAISKAVKSSLPPSLAHRAVVIHNGVAIAPPRVYGGAGAPRFVYLGRVVPWKGCHLLVKTFARLHARYGDKAGSLDLIGNTLYWDQSYRQEVQAIIEKKGIASVCRLLPHTDQPLEALSRYDVFCIASVKEPFGRVVAEAQGCGMPVIAFDDGGIGEIVEQGVTGTLVRAGDVEGFVLAMARCIDEPGCVALMGRAARERAARLFDRMVQRKRIVDLLLDKAGITRAR
ncbi:MAG: glycosyltransferase [Chitinispirillaceae bacterium]|nr:glycosyltransferase [Chitinispirillaceae bacterium]